MAHCTMMALRLKPLSSLRNPAPVRSAAKHPKLANGEIEGEAREGAGRHRQDRPGGPQGAQGHDGGVDGVVDNPAQGIGPQKPEPLTKQGCLAGSSKGVAAVEDTQVVVAAIK